MKIDSSTWAKTANGKILLKGIGKVYNCDCTAPLENNRYHHFSCASRKNLTLIYRLGLLERLWLKWKRRSPNDK